MQSSWVIMCAVPKILFVYYHGYNMVVIVTHDQNVVDTKSSVSNSNIISLNICCRVLRCRFDTVLEKPQSYADGNEGPNVIFSLTSEERERDEPTNCVSTGFRRLSPLFNVFRDPYR